jgi:hypothetical protein
MRRPNIGLMAGASLSAALGAALMAGSYPHGSHPRVVYTSQRTEPENEVPRTSRQRKRYLQRQARKIQRQHMK